MILVGGEAQTVSRGMYREFGLPLVFASLLVCSVMVLGDVSEVVVRKGRCY